MSESAQEGDTAAAEIGSAAVQELYREKPASTVVRVMTVLAYLFSVSFAAILLSVYYIWIWRSPVLQKFSDNHDMLGARRGDPNDYSPAFTHEDPHNFTGGSDTPVNETATSPTLDNIANFTNTNETVEILMNDYTENSTSIPTKQEYTSSDNEVLNVTTIT